MLVVPVLDIRHGVVVRGVGGRRAEYLPLQSRLTSSSDPLHVATVLCEHLGSETLYLADLDGILDQRPHEKLYTELASRGCRLWVDPGIRRPEDLKRVSATGANTIIVGLETCGDMDHLQRYVEEIPTERLMFSLDLQQGVPLAQGKAASMPPLEIACRAYEAGFRRLLVLDLADVGTHTGGSTTPLLQRIRTSMPDLFLVTGGGVRDLLDLQRLAALSVDAVLIASALHDGRLSPVDVAAGEFVGRACNA